MGIPRFPKRIAITNPSYLLESRLNLAVVLWPEQAISLAAYMCWPNNSTARDRLAHALRTWPHDSPIVPPELRRIQHRWLRVADIFDMHYDISQGQHQTRRGGSSIGKAVSLVAANCKSRGTGKASLWSAWKGYKNVAHLVTAAIVICAQARVQKGERPKGLRENQLLPFQMVMLAPDLVIALARSFQKYGLRKAATGHHQSALDPKTVWRIAANINVKAVAPPDRKIRPSDVDVLNARRAGNRGKANRPKTTPVSF
jgi:hypothetical protein